jgi:photosystem II stability/assembly factor-like uncharacterized protein
MIAKPLFAALCLLGLLGAAHADMYAEPPAYGGGPGRYVKPILTSKWKLSAFFGASAKELYAVGYDLAGAAVIYRSADGGASWGQVKTSISEELKDIWGSSTKSLYAVGAKGTILRSTNGKIWTAQKSGSSENLFAVWGSSPKDVYVVGASGTILHSVDAGKTWEKQASGTGILLFDIWGAGGLDPEEQRLR